VCVCVCVCVRVWEWGCGEGGRCVSHFVQNGRDGLVVVAFHGIFHSMLFFMYFFFNREEHNANSFAAGENILARKE
jgi:hypothetical protein